MGKLIERPVKLAYVKQIEEKKMTVRELQVNEATLYDWIKKHRIDGETALPGSGNQKPEDEEMRKLRDKVKQLEAEVDFLKNVTAYFAGGHGKSTQR